MGQARYPHTLGCRVNDREQARVDAAARLQGIPRAHYVKRVVLAAAERDLRRELEGEPGAAP